MSANFYKRPAERIAVTGITGTNGKSTTAFLIESILTAAGRKSALIGTIEYHVAGHVYPAPHTTPEALELARIFNEALGLGATDAVMEVSSHALAQERVFGVPFDVAVFTNLTRDHLDYHKTMDEYFAAKRVLFEGCGTDAPRAAVTNLDDEYGAKLAGFSRKRSAVVLTYGWERGDFHAENVDINPRGTRFDMATPQEKIAIFSPLIGRVNVYNILAAAAACFARGCDSRRRLPAVLSRSPTCREDLSASIAGSRSRWSSIMLTPTTRCAISRRWPASSSRAAEALPECSPCSAAAAIAIAPSVR